MNRIGTPIRTVPALAAVAALLGVGLAACGGDSGDSLVVYSGRTENLIEPLVEQFEAETGIDVETRYNQSADLALQIDLEGDDSPADVFLSQSPGALGFLDGKGRLTQLPSDVVDLVPAEAVAADDSWVGLSGRVRVLVYDSDEVDPADLPDSVFDLVEREYRGKVAIAPANGSFQDFISAMRSLVGEEETQAWLDGMHDNLARTYANNTAILEAVQRGEVTYGLINHYYNERAKSEQGDVSTENHFFAEGDPGSLTLVTGAGVVDTSDRPEEAEQFIEFLLSEEAQTFFSEETFEYPLAAGVEPQAGLPPSPPLRVDMSELTGGLERTRELIVESGLESG